jgi:capsid assembly protease
MRRRYDKGGILALNPSAFFDLFVEVDSPTNESIEGAEVVCIRGPLEHHDDWWCDSYESILDRVNAAIESTAQTVILKIDSPGGELYGCFDAARTIRKRCAAAGKKLVAYVEGSACSAAYALACAAETIYTSSTAHTGSIGILITRVDVTARDQAMGARYALVASGKRKVDGNPHAVLTDSELGAMQGQCNALAELFFELVASLRNGLDVDAIRALEADIFHGAAAVEVGLADGVASFDEMLAAIANGGTMPNEDQPNDDKETETEPSSESEQETPSSSQKDVDDARSALERAAADGDDKAQAALDVLNGSTGESDDDDDEQETESRAASRGNARRPQARREQRVSADAAGALGRTVARLEKQVGELRGERDGARLSAMLASRPDIGKEMREHLATMPYKDAKAIVDRMPKPDAPPRKTGKEASSTAVVTGTRGAGEGGTSNNGKPAPTTASTEAKAMDQAFGLAPAQNGVRREGSSLVFGTPAPRSFKRDGAALPATTTTTTDKG